MAGALNLAVTAVIVFTGLAPSVSFSTSAPSKFRPLPDDVAVLRVSRASGT